MRYNTTHLEDIELWIKMVEKEKVMGWFYKLGNRLVCPFCMFRTTDQWLKILYFEKKQEEEKVKFYNEGV